MKERQAFVESYRGTHRQAHAAFRAAAARHAAADDQPTSEHDAGPSRA